MKHKIAIITGTGMCSQEGFVHQKEEATTTPYGDPSSPLMHTKVDGKIDVIFLARHGIEHRIPPHRVNYRANIWALKQAGVESIFSLSAVGGISELMQTGVINVPDQVVDYSYGRAHTFFDDELQELHHVDFTNPFTRSLRHILLQASQQEQIHFVENGTLGVTQGPRLETAAEIERMSKDGCDTVNMTSMPEAALARELGINYGLLSVVVNRAAGLTQHVITIEDVLAARDRAAGKTNQILLTAVRLLTEQEKKK